MNIDQMDTFIGLWNKYVKTENKNLEPVAIVLKEDLIAHVKYFHPFSLGGFRHGNFTVKDR